MQFPIGGPLEPSLYFKAFSRYSAPNISGSRSWPFGGHVISWGMWPFDTQCTISYRCSIVTESLSPAVFEIMAQWAPKNPSILGSRPWPFKSRDVIVHVTIRFSVRFPIGVPLEPSVSKRSGPRPKFCIFCGLVVWGSGVTKNFDFYWKRHICVWIHVVWAILRQNRLVGLTPRRVPEKSKKVTETPIGKTCRR